jgi:hypothetical protein
VTYISEVLADTPLGFWPLDEAGGTTATDISGNARHGTYVNPGSIVFRDLTREMDEGNAGDVLLDNTGGNLGYVQVPGTGLETASFTVEGWCKSPFQDFDGGAVGVLFSMSKAGVRRWSLLHDVSTTRRWFAAVTGAVSPSMFYPVGGPGGMGNFDWYHVVLTFTASTFEFWVNGELVASNAVGILTTTGTDFIIGADLQNLANGWGQSVRGPGGVHMVALYDHVLTETRIKAHYNAFGVRRELLNLGPAVALWMAERKFSGDQIADQTGNGHDLARGAGTITRVAPSVYANAAGTAVGHSRDYAFGFDTFGVGAFSDVADVTNTGLFSILGYFTLDTLPATAGHVRSLMGLSNAPSDYQWQLYVDDTGKLHFRCMDGIGTNLGDIATPGSVIGAHRFCASVVNVKGGAQKLYLDRALVASGTLDLVNGPMVASNAQCDVGTVMASAPGLGTDEWWDGKIDDFVFVWDIVSDGGAGGGWALAAP